MSNDFEINGKTVKVNGLNIYYIEAGKGDPVILLHGWPTSSYLWRNIIPTLAKTRRVIAPDLPGYGRSDKPPDISYTFENMSRIFEGFIAFSKTITDPNLGELKEISQKIQTLKIPISIIYGENDILMASEMRRIEKELPNVSVISIPDCNHFLQEDQPEKVSELLSKFLPR